MSNLAFVDYHSMSPCLVVEMSKYHLCELLGLGAPSIQKNISQSVFLPGYNYNYINILKRNCFCMCLCFAGHKSMNYNYINNCLKIVLLPGYIYNCMHNSLADYLRNYFVDHSTPVLSSN